MFTMDVPYVPMQDTPIVLAQAAVLGDVAPGSNTMQPDYLLKTCTDVQSKGDQTTAVNGVDPAGWLAVELGNRSHRDIYDDPTALASIKITLLESTTHGKLIPHTRGAEGVYYMYEADPGYAGKDRAAFMAVFEGKTYKIVIDLNVYPETSIPDNVPSACPAPQFIKVNGKPVSGSSGLDTGSITLNIADLPGGAVGETTGTSITLDTDAAGYNWFIDPAPSGNSEFLPTANPDVWIAKAGTDAAGKMDMLSVLLHEYGHALGFEHSPNPNDFMAPDLQPGERRLPTSDELALMSQLVAQLQPVNATASGNSPAPNSPPSPTLPIGTALSALLIGRLRRTDYGAWSPVIDSVQIPAPAPQFETAANQTGPNQVFILGEHDRFLSFTLANTSLGGQAGPDNADCSHT
ncbi:MAG: matrixin family metalloprotease [Sulfuricella sp.]